MISSLAHRRVKSGRHRLRAEARKSQQTDETKANSPTQENASKKQIQTTVSSTRKKHSLIASERRKAAYIEKSQSGDAREERQDFVIECKNGETVGLSLDEATQVQEKFAFLGKKFNSKVMQRPDWNKETARHLIELITVGYTSVPEDYRGLMEAVNEIFLPVKVEHPISRQNIVHDMEVVKLISNTWNERNHKFTFGLLQPESQVKPLLDLDTWAKLLKQGIVFVELAKKFNIEVDNDRDGARDLPPNPQFFQKYSVGCTAPLYVAAYHTCSLLHLASLNSKGKGSNPRSPANRLSLSVDCYLGCCSVLEPTCRSLDVTLTYKVTKAGQEAASFSGSPVQVMKILQEAKDFIIPSGKTVCCFLSMSCPDIRTLGRLIHACQKGDDHEANLIFNVESNEYLTCRTIKDTTKIMMILADARGEMALTGPLTMVGTNEDMARNFPELENF